MKKSVWTARSPCGLCTEYVGECKDLRKCPKCKTSYLADREQVIEPDDKYTRVYLNSAKILKVGQSLWVDQIYSNAVLNAMYSFHASAAAYTEFWNNSFWNHQKGNFKKLTCCHIWQAFVQESVHSIAAVSEINLELQDGLAIDDVTKQAFSVLGENGIIHAADQHTCHECIQPYEKSADIIITGDDPAAVVGMDEGCNVPALAGEDADLAAEAAGQARENPLHAATTADQ